MSVIFPISGNNIGNRILKANIIKKRLRENADAGAPPIIMKDLSDIYNRRINYLMKYQSDYLYVLSIELDCIQSLYHEHFIHYDCMSCTRKHHYTRACNNGNFRCKNVREEFILQRQQIWEKAKKWMMETYNVIFINEKDMFAWVGNKNPTIHHISTRSQDL